MSRLLRFVAGPAIAATLLAVPFFISRAGISPGMTSVIVELRDDPGAVYAAKASQQGNAISDDQMQAYRKGLAAAQDKFLADLKASGQAFQLQSVTVGNVKIDMRYTLVYDGMALTVPSSAIPAIKAMAQVKDVHPNTRFFTTLDKSVPYIRAPESRGNRKFSKYD